MRSSVEIHNIATGRTRVVWQTERLVEAPNFSRDGRFLIINGDGLLYRLPLDGGEPVRIDTGLATRCNNDHGLSPDGAWLAISDKVEFGKSAIYVLPAGGGVPRLVTPNLPSYWHGWSPDGTTLAYCGIRNDLFDIYTIPVEGGEERRLTFGEGRNDGPDYSADGACGRTAVSRRASPTAPTATGFRTLRRMASICWCCPMTVTFSTIRAISPSGCG